MEVTSEVFLVSATLIGLFLFGVVYFVNLIRAANDEVQKITPNPPQKKEKKRLAEQPMAQKQLPRKKQDRWTRDYKPSFSHPWVLTSLKGHSRDILDMDFSANGKFIASCGDDAERDDGSSSGSSSSGIAACDGVNTSDSSSDVGSSNDAGSDSGCSVDETNKENEVPVVGRSRSQGHEAGKNGSSGRRSRNGAASPNNAAQGGQQRSRRQKKNAAPAKKSKGRGKQPSTVASDNHRQTKEDNQLLPDIPTEYIITRHSKGRIMVRRNKAVLWQVLRKYALEKDKLYDLSYPVESPGHPGHGRVYIAPSRRSTKVQAQNSVPSRSPNVEAVTHLSQRRCARCFRNFYTSQNPEHNSFGIYGDYWSADSACLYHWGKLKVEENNYMYQFSCCNGQSGHLGCSTAQYHVWVGVNEGDNGPLAGYVETQPRRKPPADGNYGVYALDCEMCYTSHGLEVTKVTVLSIDGRVVYDTFIKPENEILDYNTRFSGITPEHLNQKGATKSLKRVQRDLLSFITADTILIGHALENDLRGLKIIHATIVDTAQLFPHKRGLPYKCSLKHLAKTILNRDIQSDASGHNSFEDAYACIELVLWKLRKDTNPLNELTS